jgi:phospholipase/carboxylesterase
MAQFLLSGPRLPPRGAATHLVVLLHGYGSDGKDLIALAPHWQAVLPGAAFVAPDAPGRAPGAPGYQWFALTRLGPAEIRDGVQNAAPMLNAFLDAELARLSLPPEKLILAGFSQGAMLALHVGLGRESPPAAIVGLSGMLAASPPRSESGPPVFLAHGASDEVIPAQAMLEAAAQLGAAGRAVQWHLAHGLGHGIDPVTLDMAGGFLGLAGRGLLAQPGAVSCVTGPADV